MVNSILSFALFMFILPISVVHSEPRSLQDMDVNLDQKEASLAVSENLQLETINTQQATLPGIKRTYLFFWGGGRG